jgi:hypothetical protein
MHTIPGTSGADTWAQWFDPYLKLMAHRSVKAACYIDWNWRDTTNHHQFSWYNWGDCRVEESGSDLIGARWRQALAGPGVALNAMSRASLYHALRINSSNVQLSP